jgi:methylated-DNA-[protein]-cysteine S-methyltransferase
MVERFADHGSALIHCAIVSFDGNTDDALIRKSKIENRLDCRLRANRLQWRGCEGGRIRLASHAAPGTTMQYTTIESPIGPLLLAGNDGALRFLSFAAEKRAMRPRRDWSEAATPFRDVIRQLREYFRGELTEFDVRLEMVGTPFQLRVWEKLRTIPYGATISYGQLARRIGEPEAVRAVGAANGSNPIPIIVPCHRVIGSNGSLTGYGGGLAIKEKLLALESRQLRLL